MLYANRIKDSISSRTGTAVSRLMRLRYGSCAVLLYHRVARISTDPQLLAVSPENFNIHLGILKKEFHLLTVAGFKEHLKTEKKFPEKSVLLTFDDGYSDNHRHAMPILESHKAEALFYICTGNIGTDREFWWDDLERLILCGENFPGAFSLVIDGMNFTCSGSMSSRTKLYNDLLPVLRNLDYVTREIAFSKIRSLLPSSNPRESHRSVTELELKEMSASPSVTLGAHTVNHCSLKHLKAGEQEMEIRKSIEVIEGATGKKINDFSYPFGTGNDFDKETEMICRNFGMEFIASNRPGCVHAKSSPVSFHRFLVRDWNEGEFRVRLKSFFRR